ncbi:T9SS type A sorting domain-containing protein [uncultured Aquimarina sp.]|uniref:galactose-binding domain-containing protein n=1 Tax=uncultured Aquimarina sp. TaxID=575652 RepID=UPI002616714B|nr:T9SS type A sorting domain-containing protein [uncultured Aquimarina sp.]
MKINNQNLLVFFKGKLISTINKCCLLFILLIFSNVIIAQQPETDLLAGSWGVTFPVFGGERLDTEINQNEKNYMSGAQEIVDELPTAGHVITNLSYFAHSHYFNTRANTNVDVANEIHPAMIPSVENDGVAVEAIQLLRNSGKKIILYISTNYLDRATNEINTGWVNYYNTNFGGNEYLAYRHLIQGFVKAAASYADGYWLDTTSALRDDGNFEDFVAMIREADPTALIACGSGAGIRLEHNGNDVFVDSDGINDTNPIDYYVKLHELTDDLSDFTDGHIVPLGQGAPPNSWSYEEFMIPNIMTDSYSTFNERKALKHGWFPIRERWHSPQVPIVFDTEQAYRFVRRITDYGGMITFANTNETPNLGDGDAGHMMSDEMGIMKEINRRMLIDPKPDYVPYTRPAGASFVGETQYIEFPDMPIKEVGDPDFIAATATSGLAVSFTSSNTNVATIVNGKVRIIGPGKTTITATQAGAGTFTSAVPAERPLVVNGSIDPNPDNGDNLALNGTASQSGTQNDGIAAYANDGNTNGAFGADSVIAATGPNAWWEVDLGNEFSINEIHVYNRTDACCIGRLTNFTVSVFDGNGNTTYSQTFTDTPNPLMIIEIPSATGQIIRVQSNEIPTMNLAEVEVYGTSISNTKLVHITKRNAKGYAIDGNWEGDNTQNAYLYSQNPNNVNQQWIEIDRGNGYYTYQKMDTDYALDGGGIGDNEENVYLWVVSENNHNQHWQKVDVGGGAFKLIIRSDPSLAIDGGSGGSNLQNIGLWNSSSTSQNLHWIITPITNNRDTDTNDTSEVLMYPNPVVDQVNISLNTTEISRYTIIDINGKTILKGVINEGAISLNVNGLAKGLYLVKVSNRSKVLTSKIIKK